MKITNRLFELKDDAYADLSSKLAPNLDRNNIIGVRVPLARKLAKEYIKEDESKEFLNDLPHKYFDENMLHGLLISEIKDYDLCIKELDKFLPYVDNWATCDQMSPKAFSKNKYDLLVHIKDWLQSDKTYTIRFAAGMLMEHFLGDDFDAAYPELVAGISSDEYYVNMMRAWYFATALAKQYESIIPFIEEKKLDSWTHNKAIQKSVESYRITPEQKAYLKTLKIKQKRR